MTTVLGAVAEMQKGESPDGIFREQNYLFAISVMKTDNLLLRAVLTWSLGPHQSDLSAVRVTATVHESCAQAPLWCGGLTPQNALRPQTCFLCHRPPPLCSSQIAHSSSFSMPCPYRGTKLTAPFYLQHISSDLAHLLIKMIDVREMVR